MKLYNIEKNINLSENIDITTDKLFNSVMDAVENLDDKTSLIGNYKYEYSFLTIQQFDITPGEPRKLNSIRTIRLKKFNLSNFNLFTGEYSGWVQDFIYENEIENTDRECFANFINKDLFREFKNICNETGVKINNIELENDYLYYKNSFESNRKRNIYKINFTIPKGVSALPIWKVLEANTKHLNGKRIKASYL